MTSRALLPDPNTLHLLHLEAEQNCITAGVIIPSPTGLCPLCQHSSIGVHSPSQRVAADLAWMGYAMRLPLHVRRFFCDNPAGERQIFAQRLPNVGAASARRTLRLCDVLTVMGFALGGEAGKRLCQELHLACSPDPLLPLVPSAPLPEPSPPRLIGVDEWSYRHGKHFGTIVVDLEPSRPVALLADRDAESLATFLKHKPTGEILSRDRRGPFADAIGRRPAMERIAGICLPIWEMACKASFCTNEPRSRRQ